MHAQAEPALAHEIRREVDSADRVDIVAAFISLGGVRAAMSALDGLARRRGALRVLTTVFTGTTEVAALDAQSAAPAGRNVMHAAV